MLKKFFRTFDWSAPVLWIIILLFLGVWAYMVLKVIQVFNYLHEVATL